MLAGLFLAKFDRQGLDQLGFESFSEAFNTIGLALKGRPASVKGYRDEFDPFFPNPRKGWHKRALRSHCQKCFEAYEHLDLVSFAKLLKSLLTEGESVESAEIDLPEELINDGQPWAKRMITGAAA